MNREIIVPFKERETVIELGAIKSKSSYFIVPPDKDILLFERWNRPRLSEFIDGEDRTFGENTLYVDPIPATTFYTNVRSNIDAVDWERIKEMCKTRANNKCEICSAKAYYPHQIFLECHERFSFDIDTGVQKLVRFICLCSNCHMVTHYGLTELDGNAEKAIKHLMNIRKWDKNRAIKHINNRFHNWEMKNTIQWKLDLHMLTNIKNKLD